MPMRRGSTRVTRPELQSRVDELLDGMIERFYRDVPYATHFLGTGEVHLEYYRRHTIETILRIRRKRVIDAHVIRHFTLTDPKCAKVWCNYTDDEMLHDRLFLGDLTRIGTPEEEVYGTDPTLATKLLNGYFLYCLEFENSPMAAIASSYFLEYTTRKTQPDWLDNLEQRLGRDKVKGARAHVNQDIEEEHTDVVWETLMATVDGPEDEQKLFQHFENLFQLFCMYFTELYTKLNPDGAAEQREPVGAAH
jgi:hypothetical protein